MDEVSKELGALSARVDAAARARVELDEQLAAAKAAGATFGQLAEVLGLRSAQAAQYQHDAALGRIEQRKAESRVSRSGRSRWGLGRSATGWSWT
jgi:hypothetical protein